MRASCAGTSARASTHDRIDAVESTNITLPVVQAVRRTISGRPDGRTVR